MHFCSGSPVSERINKLLSTALCVIHSKRERETEKEKVKKGSKSVARKQDTVLWTVSYSNAKRKVNKKNSQNTFLNNKVVRQMLEFVLTLTIYAPDQMLFFFIHFIWVQ